MKLIAFVCLFALANAAPGYAPSAYSSQVVHQSPLAYSSPLSYSAPISYSNAYNYNAPLSYSRFAQNPLAASSLAYSTPLALNGQVASAYNVAPYASAQYAASPLAYSSSPLVHSASPLAYSASPLAYSASPLAYSGHNSPYLRNALVQRPYNYNYLY